jgi:hypothetical protein
MKRQEKNKKKLPVTVPSIKDVIPAAIIDRQTPSNANITLLWYETAIEESQNLVACAKLKHQCEDVMDTEGAEQAFQLAYELQCLANVLKELACVDPETASMIREASINRIVKINEISRPLLNLKIGRAQE